MPDKQDKIIITSEVRPTEQAKKRIKKSGHRCKRCGAKLTDPISIARGYGRECVQKDLPVMIVLDIIKAG